MNKIFEEFSRMIGIEIKHSVPKGSLESLELENLDGAMEIATTQGGIVGIGSLDMFHVPTTEVEQIKTYRALALTSDVDRVLTEIKNEVLIFDIPGKKAIDIEFNDTKENNLSKALINKILIEYNNIYNILDFQRRGLEIFEKWYIDGRLFLQKIINKDKPSEGIKKIVHIDSLKIKKVIEYPLPDINTGVYDLNKIRNYYIFSDIGDVFAKTTRCLEIKSDSIAYTDSGIYDNTGAALSFLWKMIVPYNNMKMMEEALLIYRVVRSPERRAFYINVGNLSKPKAEQYMKELMAKFKNKLIYDSKTGTMLDKKNIMSMVEDYWLPRRDDGKGTEIVPLPGATNLGTIDDVELFKQKFLESSNIPVGRFKDEASPFVFGRTSELNRDEYRFKKFLDRLRNRFVIVLEDILKTQLLLKNIIIDSDWDNIKKTLTWIYAEDNNFVEWKENEILNSRIETMNAVDPLVGKYFTREWALQTIMKMSDTDSKKMLDTLDKQNIQLNGTDGAEDPQQETEMVTEPTQQEVEPS